MLKINLLPPELKRKKRKRKAVVFEATQTLLILIVACEVIAFLSVYVFISVNVGSKKNALKGIRVEIDKLQAEVKEVRNLEEDAKKLEKRIQIIDQLMFSRLSWARKLNEISSLIPDNIWLISLGLSQAAVSGPGGSAPAVKNVLVLRGKVLALPGEKAVDLIGVFMNNLKFSPSFFETFSDVEFMGTTTDKMGEKEVVGFELHCPFK